MYYNSVFYYIRPVHYLYRHTDLDNGGMKPSKYRDAFKQLIFCPTFF